MPFNNLTLHIGLHKTATSFLQAHLFPRLNDIENMRWRNLEYFQRLDDAKRYLVSCEALSGFTFARRADRQKAIRVLGKMLPEARVLIVFRPHGAFVSSLYSQYLRYGGVLTVDRFFQLEGSLDLQHGPIIDAGSINFRALIEDIEQSFEKRPMVVLMSDMFSSPEQFLNDLGEFAGCDTGAALTAFANKPVNAGLKRWQGEILRKVNRAMGVRLSLDGRNRPYAKFARLGIDPPTLLLEKLAFFPSRPLVSDKFKSQIDEQCAEDWRFVVSYAQEKRWRNDYVSPGETEK